MKLRAFACFIAGHEDHKTVIHHVSAGKAKYELWRQVTDPLPDLPFTAVRVRVIGGPITSAGFRRNAEYRGIPFAYVAMRVEVGGKPGWIVGHNCCANLDVLFEDGRIGNCHPLSEVRYFEPDGTERFPNTEVAA